MKLRLETPALAPREEHARMSHAKPVITLTAELQRDEALAALVRGIGAAGGRAATLRASLRQGAGFLVESGAVFTHQECVDEALRAGMSSLAAHDVLIVEGPLALDALSSAVSIGIVRNPSPASLSPDLRAVRHRVDLWLFEARPVVLETVAAGVLAGGHEPVVASPA